MLIAVLVICGTLAITFAAIALILKLVVGRDANPDQRAAIIHAVFNGARSILDGIGHVITSVLIAAAELPRTAIVGRRQLNAVDNSATEADTQVDRVTGGDGSAGDQSSG